MKKTLRSYVVPSVAAVALALSAGMAAARDDDQKLSARLSGLEETPAAVSTSGKGSFTGKIDPTMKAIDYELSYSGLQGTISQAHIHIGRRGTGGGIAIWLCGTPTPIPPATAATPGPAGTPTCPAGDGMVTGTIKAENVIGPAGQLIAPGQLDEVLALMRAGAAYVNIHTGTNAATGLPGVGSGEIRGQIRLHR